LFVTLSTITPVYRGAKYLSTLVGLLTELKEFLETNTDNVRLIESIFVLDDPQDNSLEVLNELSKELKWVKVIELSKNFGQHPATIAGLLYSSGDWLITLDEDLQHHPKFIPDLLLTCIDKSADICYANSDSSIHNSFIRDKVSIYYKKLIGWITKNKNIKYFNSFRLIRGSIGRSTAAVCRHETYFDIALSWYTNRVSSKIISMTDERFQETNKSGYSLYSLLKHAKRMIMTSHMKFLRIGIIIGLFSFFVSILFGSYSLLARLLSFELVGVKGWSSIFIATVFFGGIISLITGIILETTSTLLLNIQGKPTFFVVDRSKDKLIIDDLKNIS